jgi:hypothetical protein
MKFAQRIQNIQPSMTLAISAKAQSLKEQGIDVIGFGAGEPDFSTSKSLNTTMDWPTTVSRLSFPVARNILFIIWRKYFGMPATKSLSLLRTGCHIRTW